MNKEIEEAIEEFEKLIKLRKNKRGEITHDSCIVLTPQLEIVLNYIKDSTPNSVIREKIEELKNKSGGNVFHIQQTINAEINLLEEILKEGEK